MNIVETTYACVKCGGPIVPGVNGFIHGLSAAPNADPSGAIRDTFRGLHYAQHCGAPDKEVEPLKLHPDEN